MLEACYWANKPGQARCNYNREIPTLLIYFNQRCCFKRSNNCNRLTMVKAKFNRFEQQMFKGSL